MGNLWGSTPGHLIGGSSWHIFEGVVICKCFHFHVFISCFQAGQCFFKPSKLVNWYQLVGPFLNPGALHQATHVPRDPRLHRRWPAVAAAALPWRQPALAHTRHKRGEISAAVEHQLMKSRGEPVYMTWQAPHFSHPKPTHSRISKKSSQHDSKIPLTLSIFDQIPPAPVGTALYSHKELRVCACLCAAHGVTTNKLGVLAANHFG